MTTTGTWYPPSLGTGGFLHEGQLFTNPPFYPMTETLREKLIRCGWASNFSVDTLVKLIERHYATLVADGPAVPEGREPAAVMGEPSDAELLELMPQQFRDDLATVSRLASYGTPVEPGIYRVSLNTGALDFARAVLARWGHQPAPPAEGEVGELVAHLRGTARGLESQAYPHTAALITRAADLLEQRHPAPVPVSERLPGPEDCDKQGRCWLLTVEDEYPQWRLHSIQGAQSGGAMIWVPVDSSPGVMIDCFYTSHWLPAHALPIPKQQENTND